MLALRDMALFVEVVRAASFTRAAANMGMPVSSLSRRIASLERTVGLRLLERTTRRVTPTEAGAVYFSRCEAIVAEAAVAHEDLHDRLTKPRGLLRVSLTGDFGTLFFAPLIVAFRREHPEITFELDMSPRRVDLAGEGFDLALRIGSMEESGLIARRLAMLRIALFASPTYLAERGAPDRPEDLQRHDTIRIHPGPDNAVWRLTKGDHRADAPLNSPIVANSLGMIRRLALLGAGIGVMDEGMAREDVAAGRLARVLPDWTLDVVPIHAVTTSRLLPAKTRAFIDFLVVNLSAASRTYGTAPR